MTEEVRKFVGRARTFASPLYGKYDAVANFNDQTIKRNDRKYEADLTGYPVKDRQLISGTFGPGSSTMEPDVVLSLDPYPLTLVKAATDAFVGSGQKLLRRACSIVGMGPKPPA